LCCGESNGAGYLGDAGALDSVGAVDGADGSDKVFSG